MTSEHAAVVASATVMPNTENEKALKISKAFEPGNGVAGMCEKSAQLKRALFSQSSGYRSSGTGKQAVQDAVRALPWVSPEVGDEQIHGSNNEPGTG
jgi:hypothetical protein